jgi:hypothetical protein
MTRSTKAAKARQLNAAYGMLQGSVALPEAMQRLSREFRLSERQAVEVSEASVPITLKLPAGTARLLRTYARSSGQTIGAIVARALAAFLSTQRRHG